MVSDREEMRVEQRQHTGLAQVQEGLVGQRIEPLFIDCIEAAQDRPGLEEVDAVEHAQGVAGLELVGFPLGEPLKPLG